MDQWGHVVNFCRGNGSSYVRDAACRLGAGSACFIASVSSNFEDVVVDKPVRVPEDQITPHLVRTEQ